MTLAVIFAGGVYAVALVQGVAAREPSFFHAPTGVYLLIVIGTAGTILGGVAFWCDRYGLPAILLAIGYVVVMFKLCDTDHYFELYSRRSAEGPPPLPLLAEHDYEQLAAPLVPDPTLAAAVRLSATFSYASPVARPLRPPAATRRGERGPPERDAVPATDPEGHTLFDLHLCDGGYADNTGVVAAVEACAAIIDGLPADRPPPFDRIHVLRIEPFPAARGGPPRGSTGFWKAVLGPVISLLSARVATQLDRAGQDLLRLAAIARRRGIDVASTTIRFGDHADPHTSGTPPLSWALSTAQQTAIEHCWQAWEAHGRAASQP